MADLNEGDAIPELRVTPDKYLPHRYAGASGDFNPIHIDNDFAQMVGLPAQHPPRALFDGAGRLAPRPRRRAATRARCGGSASSSAAWAFPEEEIVVSGTVTGRDGDAGRDRHRGLPGRQRNRPQRRGRAASCPEPPAGGVFAALPRIRAVLSERQQLILEIAVDAYLKTGTPVGSKAIAERADFDRGASTVRAELAALEREGYLSQPHTSAGRVPTDAGYRRYADSLIESGARPAREPTVTVAGLAQARREIEDALRETTAALAQANDLLALATAPAGEHRDDPPRRGPAPAAARRRRRRDRRQRRRRQARLHVRRRRSTPAWSSGPRPS